MWGRGTRRCLPAAFSAYLDRRLPERHVVVRTDGRVRHMVWSTRRQVLALAGVAGLSAALVGAVSVHILRQYDEIARTEAELAQLMEQRDMQERELAAARASFQAAFQTFDQSERVFGEVASEIERIETSLRVMASYGGDAPAAGRAQLSTDNCSPAARRRAEGLQEALAPADDLQPLRHGIAQVEDALSRLKAEHTAFVHYATKFAHTQASQIEEALAAVGLDAAELRSSRRFGAGGPYLPHNRDAAAAWAGTLGWLDLQAARWSNLNLIAGAMPLGLPVANAEINSGFGVRSDPINTMQGDHEGIDFGAPHNTPVSATGGGVVKSAGWAQRFGKMVEIDHGLGVVSRYAHLACVLVTHGQKVDRGTVIGLVGATGRATGPHLHYEIRVGGIARDPRPFLTAARDMLKAR